MRKEINKLNIGVLSLQGAFREHVKALIDLGVDVCNIRLPDQLDDIDGLVIPGGESTTIDNLMERYGFKQKIKRFAESKKPIFGTCAGMILLARKTKENIFGLGLIDIEVRRNAYGRQIDSFENIVEIYLNGLSNGKKKILFKAVFIRAPRILGTGKEVKVLSRLGEEAILVRQDNILAGSFHPELTEDLRVHKYFLDMVTSYKKEGAVKCQVIQNGIQ